MSGVVACLRSAKWWSVWTQTLRANNVYLTGRGVPPHTYTLARCLNWVAVQSLLYGCTPIWGWHRRRSGR
jgi:hypothetical protein